MKKYTYAAYDWAGRLVELTIVEESKAKAGKMARGILESAREYINPDAGILLSDEVDCE